MKKNIILFLLLFWITQSHPAFSDVIQGVVAKDGINTNRVIDSQTNRPIGRAKITIPQLGYKTYTDNQGHFALGAKVDGQTVMSVEKAGYKPFSLTINGEMASKPIVLGIEKATPHDITIETAMFHLGDNNFSELSANAREFKVQSIGPYYSKDFKIPAVTPNSTTNLIIGSIIGVDTLMAKQLGQNKVNNAYASPPEIYFNGSKIAEININGDGQKVKIPSNLIKPNQMNEVTIKTGRNLMQTAHVDYDDIEFMNLSIESN